MLPPMHELIVVCLCNVNVTKFNVTNMNNMLMNSTLLLDMTGTTLRLWKVTQKARIIATVCSDKYVGFFYNSRNYMS